MILGKFKENAEVNCIDPSLWRIKLVIDSEFTGKKRQSQPMFSVFSSFSKINYVILIISVNHLLPYVLENIFQMK